MITVLVVPYKELGYQKIYHMLQKFSNFSTNLEDLIIFYNKFSELKYAKHKYCIVKKSK
jgi:hypothetical protein